MFYKIFLECCNRKGISPTAACKELGLSNATATHWSKGSKPHSSTLHKIADYFGVTVDYLLGNETEPAEAVNQPDPQFKEALMLYKTLSPEKQKHMYEYLKFLASQK